MPYCEFHDKRTSCVFCREVELPNLMPFTLAEGCTMRRVSDGMIFYHVTNEDIPNLEHGSYLIMKPSQAVTIRYASNLLCAGINKEFTIASIFCEPVIINGDNIGSYYTVTLESNLGKQERAAAETPLAAVRRALEKHGVTFR